MSEERPAGRDELPELLAPAGSVFTSGACTKQCHAVSCELLERHGCHDHNCIERFGPVQDA